jgi:hypothetical protein
MSSKNVFNNHPIIPNANEYYYEKKYLSIHSEDRDISKYPSSSQFIIEFPQDYLNVASVKLHSWSFPLNYDVFSILNQNISMTFKFNKLYNPEDVGILDNFLLSGIYAALYDYYEKELDFIVFIEQGVYTPEQMAIELTNKFNEAVTNQIDSFFTLHPAYAQAQTMFHAAGGYSRFKIVYNKVNQKLWFGNTADQFIIVNNSCIYLNKEFADFNCLKKENLPQFVNWGLPYYLGFDHTDVIALTPNQIYSNIDTEHSNTKQYIQFYYDEHGKGTWLQPTTDMSGAETYVLQAPYKTNMIGPTYMYMEIDGLNCIDETSPWNISVYNEEHNNTNGVVNSSFAKITLTPNPSTSVITEWLEEHTTPYKYFNPPAERIRKLKIKLRYHNGQLVDFSNVNYSFMLEFNLLHNQPERTYSVRNAFDLTSTVPFKR